MGKFLDEFKRKGSQGLEISRKAGVQAGKFGRRVDSYINNQVNKPQKWKHGRLQSEKEVTYGKNMEDFYDDDFIDEQFNEYNPYIDNVQPAQKPASFHHFILENQYKDLEKSIRGYKDVYNKETMAWEIKRKANHCFTDEEAEEILRTAQSHLSTDIKLTFYDKLTFGIRFLAVYEKVEFLFKRIMEYRFGRFGGAKKQGEMKDQALKIFVELITRIEANYLRAISGNENKLTHDSVKSQESLQGIDTDLGINKGYT